MIDSFYIGRIFTVRFDVTEVIYAWLRDENPELHTWISDTVAGAWEIRTELDFYEYDTSMQAVNVFIEYDNPSDAVHHRIRWT